MGGAKRDWIGRAIGTLRAERQRSADTHLLRLAFPEFPDLDIYLKDETIHPTGSLKHRLARSLFLHGIANGDIVEGTHVIEASSGSTAIAEAWFARLLGLKFTAVIPATTAPAKIAAIGEAGGEIHFARAGENLCAVAAGLARAPGSWFMDQFTYAERATDWRGNNNIAQSIFEQLGREPHPAPAWVVAGAGTGGTSATIGRYLRYRPELARTRLCVVDPEGSALFRAFPDGARDVTGKNSDLVEGIGRRFVPASFVPGVIDRMIAVPDAASLAAMRWLARRTGRRFGPSTGTNFVGVLALAAEEAAARRPGSIVTLACDAGERYAQTVYDDAWLAAQGVDLRPWTERLEAFERSGRFDAQGLETRLATAPR